MTRRAQLAGHRRPIRSPDKLEQELAFEPFV
jgi:hypothetical protein